MKVYELTFILDTSLDDNAVEAEINKIGDQIKASEGEVLEVQKLGVKRMTFEIKKQRQGNYISVYYKAAHDVPKKIESSMKLNEAILRSLTLALKPSEYKSAGQEKEKSGSTDDEKV